MLLLQTVVFSGFFLLMILDECLSLFNVYVTAAKSVFAESRVGRFKSMQFKSLI